MKINYISWGKRTLTLVMALIMVIPAFPAYAFKPSPDAGFLPGEFNNESILEREKIMQSRSLEYFRFMKDRYKSLNSTDKLVYYFDYSFGYHEYICNSLKFGLFENVRSAAYDLLRYMQEDLKNNNYSNGNLGLDENGDFNELQLYGKRIHEIDMINFEYDPNISLSRRMLNAYKEIYNQLENYKNGDPIAKAQIMRVINNFIKTYEHYDNGKIYYNGLEFNFNPESYITIAIEAIPDGNGSYAITLFDNELATLYDINGNTLIH